MTLIRPSVLSLRQRAVTAHYTAQSLTLREKARSHAPKAHRIAG